jgi:hypothetical protein
MKALCVKTIGKTATTTALAAAAIGLARAEDATQPRDSVTTQQAQVQIQVQADAAGGVVVGAAAKDGEPASGVIRSNGRTVIVHIGPDGKVEIKDAAPADVAEKVKGATEAVEKQAAEARQASERLESQAPNGTGFGFGMQGSITVIGPDGVQHTQKFEKFGTGDGTIPDVRELVEKSLEAAGAELPAYVGEKLRQAFQQQGATQIQAVGPPAGDVAAISRKLDSILEKLERLERDVAALKAAQPEK